MQLLRRLRVLRHKKRQQTKTQLQTNKSAVAAAIARAKAKTSVAAQKESNLNLDNSEMSKLREERKRQARERYNKQLLMNPTESSGDGKKDAVSLQLLLAPKQESTTNRISFWISDWKSGDAKERRGCCSYCSR